MSDHEPIQQQYHDLMNDVAHRLGDLFRPNTFILLVSEPGERGSGKRTNYISNGKRQDMHRVMREFLDNQKIDFDKLTEAEKDLEINERALLVIDLAEKLNRTVSVQDGKVTVQPKE